MPEKDYEQLKDTLKQGFTMKARIMNMAHQKLVYRIDDSHVSLIIEKDNMTVLTMDEWYKWMKQVGFDGDVMSGRLKTEIVKYFYTFNVAYGCACHIIKYTEERDYGLQPIPYCDAAMHNTIFLASMGDARLHEVYEDSPDICHDCLKKIKQDQEIEVTATKKLKKKRLFNQYKAR